MTGSRFKRSLCTLFSFFATAGAAHAALPDEPVDHRGLRLYPSVTAQSRYIAAEQARHGDRNDLRIVMIDRDWLAVNEIMNEGRGREDFNPWTAMVDYYSGAVTGLRFVDDRTYSQIAHALADDNGAASREPVRIRDGEVSYAASGEKTDSHICFIVPYRTDFDPDTDFLVRYFKLSPSRHGPLARAKLNRDGVLPPQDMMVFSNAHERGHCFDRWELKDYKSSLTAGRKVEMFGEIYGLINSARKNYHRIDDIAAKRIDFRLAMLALDGPQATRVLGGQYNPGNGNLYAYELRDALKAGLEAIKLYDADEIRNMTDDEAALLAHRVVEDVAVRPHLSPQGLAQLLGSGFDPERVGVSERERARDLLAAMERAVRNILDLSGLEGPALKPEHFVMKNVHGERLRFREPEKHVERLAGELREHAGGAAASEESLARAYGAVVDRARGQFGAPDHALGTEGMRDLALLPNALRMVLREVRAGKTVQVAPRPAN